METKCPVCKTVAEHIVRTEEDRILFKEAELECIECSCCFTPGAQWYFRGIRPGKFLFQAQIRNVSDKTIDIIADLRLKVNSWEPFSKRVIDVGFSNHFEQLAPFSAEITIQTTSPAYQRFPSEKVGESFYKSAQNIEEAKQIFTDLRDIGFQPYIINMHNKDEDMYFSNQQKSDDYCGQCGRAGSGDAFGCTPACYLDT